MQDTTLYPGEEEAEIVQRVRSWTGAFPHVEHAFQYHNWVAIRVSEDMDRVMEDSLIGMMLRKHLRLKVTGEVHNGNAEGRWLYFVDEQHRL
jgi:hypothetical protein